MEVVAMLTGRALTRSILVALCLLLPATARAARVRYHFVPNGPKGEMLLTPAVPGGPSGELLTWTGGVRGPYNCPPPRPTRMVPFVHPCTQQPIVLPLALPVGTPVVEHRRRGTWISYNYGSYAVEVDFQPDGSVNVVYNSGLLRAP
jgi:hypothetical protein